MLTYFHPHKQLKLAVRELREWRPLVCTVLFRLTPS